MAVEMARQVEAAGEEVACLVAFDSQAPRIGGLRKRLSRRWKRLMEESSGSAEASAADAAESFAQHIKRAKRRHRPKIYPGRVTLFSCEGSIAKQSADWEKSTGGRVDSEQVPGDHSTLFREPHVQTVAQRLDARLAEAAARSQNPEEASS